MSQTGTLPPATKPREGGGKKSAGPAKPRSASAKDADAAAAGADAAVNSSDLESRNKSLLEDVEKERRQRNYFQLQGEKLTEYWEITKRELEESRANLRIKEREMEDMEERHQVEIKVYQQQVKHLMLEHTNDVAQLKTEAEAGVRVQADEFVDREGDLRAANRRLQSQLREAQRSHDELSSNLKLLHEQQLTRLRGDFEDRCRELEQRYERRTKQVREEMELRRKAEVREIEERKNAHINDLMRRHEKAFQEMKAYYNDIFISNADLIKTLKEQLVENKQREVEREKEVSDVRAENKRLAEPLNRAQSEVRELTSRLSDYDKDKNALKSSKGKVKQLEALLKQLQWENEALIQRFEQVQRERDDLYSKFVSAIRDVQQKASVKNMLLEQKITAFGEALESKEAQLGEIIRAANLDPESAALAQKQVQGLLEDKNGVIRDLQYELAKVSKAHADMLRTYEAKLEEHGVPKENLGFTAQKPSIPPIAASIVVGNQ